MSEKITFDPHQSTGFSELCIAFKQHFLWLWLGFQDIRLRYRRSVLGPWWLTISTGIMVAALGFLYAKIFKMNIAEYLPYFAAGNVVWVFISSQINESVSGFEIYAGVLRQVRIPLPTCILRILFRNLIVLAHNAVIVFFVIFVIGHGLSWESILMLPGLLITTVIVWSISMLVSIFCTRFRDFGQVVASILQIAFFVTPILWQPGVLGRSAWAAKVNPLYHMVEIIRAPLLGQVPHIHSYLISTGVMCVSVILAIFVFMRYRTRITFWL